MSATHTHSGSAIGYDYDSIISYRDKFNKAAVKAAEAAIADIAYSVRDYVENNADCHVAYFIGAADDQVPSS